MEKVSPSSITEADRRVAVIGYRLNQANLVRCPVHGFEPGVVIQAIDEFPAAQRKAARAVFSLGNRPTVTAVVPGSPAADAGVQPSDALLAIGGSAVAPVLMNAPGTSYTTVRNALDAIDAAAAGHSQVTLSVERHGTILALAMAVVPGCAIRVQVIPSRELNGFASDAYGTITTALEHYATSDDELALFLGHELAHAYLRHQARLDRAAPLRRVFGRALLPSSTVLNSEREVDRLGMILAARAGYDVSVAPGAWRRLGAACRTQSFTRTHPGTRDRIAAATAEAAEIRRRQQAGLPL